MSRVSGVSGVLVRSAKPSSWWPTPTAVGRWFTAEERDRSILYHQPRERARRLKSSGQLVSMMLIWWLAEADLLAVDRIWFVAAVGWWFPSTLAAAWGEFRHEPRFGRDAGSLSQFLASTTGILVVHLALFATLSAAIATAPTSRLDASALAAIAFVLLPYISLLVGPALTLAVHRAKPLTGSAAAELAEVAKSANVGSVRFVEVVDDPHAGPNAFATGVGRWATVAVSANLAGASAELRRHIVAHELAHIRRHHMLWTASVTALAGAGVAVMTVAVAWQFGSDSGRLPAVVLILWALGVPMQLVLAWLSRAHERQADIDAGSIIGVSAEAVRGFHVSDRALLEPSFMARVFAEHPSPSERLELMHRMRS